MSIEYHPVSRKYIRYLLEGLNEEDSGPGIFAQLARSLLHRRKCANILPATEPSAGGDHGQDARTHRVLLDSDNRFRLFTSAPTTEERWIFAFSIRKDWQRKLSSDVAIIMANNLRPDAIIFVTNQFIHPEHIKIDHERKIMQRYGVRCEILDGQWILDLLYEDDYPLAVEFLGCPSEADPKLMEMFQRMYGLKEGGLTEEEAAEFEQLKQQVQYRNRYIDTPEHLIQDLRRMGDILASYDTHLEEAIAWYEEGLPELDRLTNQADGIILLYAYFKGLYKLPGGPAKIYSLLPKFIDLVFASGAPVFYRYPGIWLQFLLPHFKGQKEFDTLYRQTVERFRTLDCSKWSELRKAYLDEALLYLDFFLIIEDQEDDRNWFKQVHAFLQRIEKIEAFPRNHFAKVLSSIAPFRGHLAEYEDCFDLAMELESKQEGGFSKAITLQNRAVAHAKASQWQEAIVMISRAKKLWINERSLRSYLIAAQTCAIYYNELKCYQAAEYELLEGLHVAVWQRTSMERDMIANMFAALASLALEQGRVLYSFRWFQCYLSFCSQYRLQPEVDILTAFCVQNAPTAAIYLYKYNRPVHDRLVNLIDEIHPSILQAHKDINLSSEEEFERWLTDLPPEQQVKSQDLRRQAHTAERSQFQGWVEYDELAPIQYIEWPMSVTTQELLSFRITYPRDPALAHIAFTLATTMQIYLVFLTEKLAELSIVDDQIWISLKWLTEKVDSPQICTEFEDEKVSMTVKVSHLHAEQIAGPTSDGVLSLLFPTVLDLFLDVTLDPEDEIMALFEDGEGIERFFNVAHPGYLWKMEYAKLVSGVDDAS